MKRIITAADRHPWLVIWGLVVFVLVVMTGSFTFYFSRESSSNDREAKARAAALIVEAKNRAEEVKLSGIRTCKAAVTAVSNDFKEEMTKLLNIVTDRFAETGRPVPPIYLALEAEVSNRQPPVAACEPKENP